MQFNCFSSPDVKVKSSSAFFKAKPPTAFFKANPPLVIYNANPIFLLEPQPLFVVIKPLPYIYLQPSFISRPYVASPIKPHNSPHIPFPHAVFNTNGDNSRFLRQSPPPPRDALLIEKQKNRSRQVPIFEKELLNAVASVFKINLFDIVIPRGKSSSMEKICLLMGLKYANESNRRRIYNCWQKLRKANFYIGPQVNDDNQLIDVPENQLSVSDAVLQCSRNSVTPTNIAPMGNEGTELNNTLHTELIEVPEIPLPVVSEVVLRGKQNSPGTESPNFFDINNMPIIFDSDIFAINCNNNNANLSCENMTITNEGKNSNNYQLIEENCGISSDDDFQLKQPIKKISNKKSDKNKWIETNNEIIIEDDVWNTFIYNKETAKFKTSDYMDIFREAFKQFYPCVINAKDRKIRSNSIKIYTYKCVHAKCPRKYLFTHIKNSKPFDLHKNTKSFKISYQGDEIVHERELSNQLKGFNRQLVREKLKTNYATDFQNETRYEVDLNLKSLGNLGNFKSLQVLNRVRGEALASQDKDEDAIEDLKKRMLDERMVNNISLYNLTIMPSFCIHSLSKNQIHVIKKLQILKNQKNSELRINLDATGTVCKLPKDNEGVMYLYAIVINIKNADGVSSMNFPLSEMITNLHTSYNIKLFLSFFKHELELYNLSWPCFEHIITDFSKALINGVSLGFNDMKLINYINLNYEWLEGKNLERKNELIKIHLCYSHLVKNFLKIIKKHYGKNDKIVIYKILIILKYIMNENNYIKIKFCWQYLWALCTHKNKNVIENEILPKLNEILKNNFYSNNIENNQDYEDYENLPFDDDYCLYKNYNTEDKQFYSKSKFYIDFKNISVEQDDNNLANACNIYYKPAFIKEILKNFIPYIPLWAPIIEYKKKADDPLHFTNAPIESFFGELKNQCQKKANEIGKLPIKVGRFLNFLGQIIDTKSFEIINEFPRKKFTNVKKVVEHRETWGKKKKNIANKHFSNAKLPSETESLRVVKDGVIIRGTEESDSTDFGDDENENNMKFSNGLMKNPTFYYKQMKIKNKIIDFVVAKIHNREVSYNSFNSFTGNEWVENFVIDIYLKMKYENVKTVNIQPFAIGSILFLGNLTNNELKEMAKNFDPKAKILIFPIFEENHFYVIVVDCIKEMFAIADSMPVKKNEKKFYENKFNNFYNIFNHFSNEFNTNNSQSDFKFPMNLTKIVYENCNKQIDQNNCGIYMLIHIAQYIQKNCIYVDEKINLNSERKKIQKEILKSSDPMHDLCLVCGKNVNMYGDSVRCSLCHRYIHVEEIDTTSHDIKINEKFYCPLCK